MKNILDLNLNNKKVIVRCDFNVPLDDENNIIDDTRIVKSLKTINYLLSNNCKIILLSHFGRVKNEEDKKKYNLNIVAKRLSEHLNKKVTFINSCFGENVKNYIDQASDDIIMLQNTRYMDLDGKLESNNDVNLSYFWSSLADVFINDAFASSHRKHASVAGISNFIPSAIGFLIMEEICGLKPIVNLDKRPFGIFMGGAKVEDKLPIIKQLINKCDVLMLGGGILNSFLKATGYDVKKSLCTNDEVVLNELRELLRLYPHKIYMPKDFIWGDDKILDIKIDEYEDIIMYCKLIFVNGTAGLYEKDEYSEGTKKLLSFLQKSGNKVIVGGGDTISALNKFGYQDCFDFVSSGGGASLEYIAYAKLDALKDLNNNKFIVINTKNKLNGENLVLFEGFLKDVKINNKTLVVCHNSDNIPNIKSKSYILGSQEVSDNKNVLYTILGHADSRNGGKTIDTVSEELKTVLSKNVIPILCIGEKESEISNKQEVLKEQLSSLKICSDSNVLIAYEPVWAIGKNAVLDIDSIKEICAFIKEYINNTYKINVKLLYGGSISAKNIDDILNISEIDGVMLSKNGIDKEALSSIIKTINNN